MNGLIFIIKEQLRDEFISYLKTLSVEERAVFNLDNITYIFTPLNCFFIRHFNIVMYVDKYSYAFTYYDTKKDEDKIIKLLKRNTGFIKCEESDKGIEMNMGICVLEVIRYISCPF